MIEDVVQLPRADNPVVRYEMCLRPFRPFNGNLWLQHEPHGLAAAEDDTKAPRRWSPQAAIFQSSLTSWIPHAQSGALSARSQLKALKV